MLHLTLSNILPTHLGHDINQGVNTAFARIYRMDLFVAILWLSNATVGQGVSHVVGVGTKVFFVAGMGKGLL